MPVLPYSTRLEPANDAAIWRFTDLRKFRDLIASEELYFRRADLFTDKSEGLPPEDYVRMTNAPTRRYSSGSWMAFLSP